MRNNLMMLALAACGANGDELVEPVEPSPIETPEPEAAGTNNPLALFVGDWDVFELGLRVTEGDAETVQVEPGDEAGTLRVDIRFQADLLVDFTGINRNEVDLSGPAVLEQDGVLRFDVGGLLLSEDLDTGDAFDADLGGNLDCLVSPDNEDVMICVAELRAAPELGDPIDIEAQILFTRR